MVNKMMFALLVTSVAAAWTILLWTVLVAWLNGRVFRVGTFAFRLCMDWPLIERVAPSTQGSVDATA